MDNSFLVKDKKQRQKKTRVNDKDYVEARLARISFKRFKEELELEELQDYDSYVRENIEDAQLDEI